MPSQYPKKWPKFKSILKIWRPQFGEFQDKFQMWILNMDYQKVQGKLNLTGSDFLDFILRRSTYSPNSIVDVFGGCGEEKEKEVIYCEEDLEEFFFGGGSPKWAPELEPHNKTHPRPVDEKAQFEAFLQVHGLFKSCSPTFLPSEGKSKHGVYMIERRLGRGSKGLFTERNTELSYRNHSGHATTYPAYGNY
jgi:hypothetical protein